MKSTQLLSVGVVWVTMLIMTPSARTPALACQPHPMDAAAFNAFAERHLIAIEDRPGWYWFDRDLEERWLVVVSTDGHACRVAIANGRAA